MEEGKIINLESNTEGTLSFIVMVNGLSSASYKNIFNPQPNATAAENSQREKDISLFNRILKNANPALQTPIPLADLKSSVLDTLSYINKQVENEETKKALEQRIQQYDEDFSIDQKKLEQQMDAINSLSSEKQTRPGIHYFALVSPQGKIDYLQRVVGGTGFNKWQKVNGDNSLSDVPQPSDSEIANYKKVEFNHDPKANKTFLKSAQEAVAKAIPPSRSLPPLPPKVASQPVAAKFPSTGPVASSAAKPVTASFEEKLFEYGGSLSKNTQGNFLYKHKDGGEITHDTNGIWRGTPAPPADDLGKQADHLVKDAIALITVDLASQKAANTNAPINLKMDGITNDDQRGALEAMVLQKIARKIQSDPSLKGITNPISVNGKTLPALAKTAAIEPAAPAMSIERSAKKSWVPDRAPPKAPERKKLPIPPQPPHRRPGK